MNDFDSDDVRAMREQGDLGPFLRQQIRRGRSQRTSSSSPPTTRPVARQPGAWPPGTRPPGPAPETGTPAQWEQALDDYRECLRQRMAHDDIAEETP